MTNIGMKFDMDRLKGPWPIDSNINKLRGCKIN